MSTHANTVHDALKALASVDGDYARKRNDVGFNGVDTAFGNDLARRESLTIKQEMAGYKMLRKYRRQLLTLFDIDYDQIPVPSVPTPAAAHQEFRRVDYGNGTYFVKFSYNPEIVDAIKTLPRDNRKWDGESRTWLVTPSAATVTSFVQFLQAYKFTGTSDAHAALKRLLDDHHRAEQAYAAVVAASSAEDSDVEVAGLNGELRPFQRVAVDYADKVGLNLLIGDEMGLGKTIEALAIAEHRGEFPVLILCPASLKYNWKREIDKWLPHRSVAIVNGGEVKPADFVIINYDLLSRDIAPSLDANGNQVKVRNRKQWRATGRLASLMEIPFKLLLADESHYLKGEKSLRTIATLMLSEKIGQSILMTGTPIINRPVELLPQLQILGRLKDFGGLWRFLQTYCGAKQVWTGSRHVWDFRGHSNLDELNARLRRTCYLRRLKTDVLSELPEKVRTPIYLDLSNAKEYEKAEDDLIAWLRDSIAHDRDFLYQIDTELEMMDLDEPERKLLRAERVHERQISKESAARRAQTLVKINALREIVGRGKIKAAIEWIEDFLASEEKLIVFAWHKKVQAALLRQFPDAAHVLAEDDAQTRDQNVTRFQEDPNCRLMISSIKAGGVGLTLTAASNVAFVELGWTPGEHDQAEDRAHRIGQEASSVNVWYLLANSTIDQTTATLIETKRSVVRQAADGQVGDFSGSILGDLISSLMES